MHLGCIWALVLDCGEDKDDGCNEYGHTVACHDFRLKETRFIKKTILNKASEYEKEGVKYKLLLSHVPFAQRYEDPFNPEEEIYTEWCTLCRKEVHPDLWLTGHKHKLEVLEPGCSADHFGQPCTCIIGSRPDYKDEKFTCAFITLDPGCAKVIFRDSDGNVTEPQIIDF